MAAEVMPKFGQELHDAEYSLKDPCVAFTNHGSFGCSPKTVMQTQARIREELVRNADMWFLGTEGSKWLRNIQQLAGFLNCRPEDLVFVQNPTSGTNAVFKSIKFQPGDVILLNNYTYLSVKMLCDHIVEFNEGVEILTVDIKLPIASRESLINQYREFLNACKRDGKRIRIAVIALVSAVVTHIIRVIRLDLCRMLVGQIGPVLYITTDAIVSSTALLMPYKELTALCQSYGVMVLVDAAHAPGHIELNIDEIKADFLVATLHKWMFTPHGCGILWCAERHQSWVRPVISCQWSHCGRDLPNDFHKRFAFQGTLDLSVYYTSETALKFLCDLGGLSAVNGYCTSLLDKASAYLMKLFNTERFPVPKDMEAPHMRVIGLPSTLLSLKDPSMSPEICGGKLLMYLLADKHKVQAQTVKVDGKLWLRISAHVYTTMKDFETLGNAVCQILKEHTEREST